MSSQIASLESRIKQLDSAFLPDKSKQDIDCTPEEILGGVAFRVLASAHIEAYVEERCLRAARDCVDEFIKKGSATTAVRALLTWFAVNRKPPLMVAVHLDDVLEHAGSMEDALKSYDAVVKGTHGLDAKDLRRLLNPIGVRSHHYPAELSDRLESLASLRNPAVHTYITKAMRGAGPSTERKSVERIVELLKDLDDTLDEVSTTYPTLPPGP